MRGFREILRTQWQWSRLAVLFCAVGAFSVPILSVQRATAPGSQQLPEAGAFFLAAMERWSVLYTVLAAGLGLALGMLAWSADHRGRHVYALALPIERWRYVLLRFLAGVALIGVPAGFLLAGSLFALGGVVIPDGLHPYPFALLLRFVLASLVAFSIFFAISSGTTRTAALVLAPVALILAVDVLFGAAGLSLDLTEAAAMKLLSWPGLLEIFTGRWLLVDV